jgi:Phosphotransferase enzyme family
MIIQPGCLVHRRLVQPTATPHHEVSPGRLSRNSPAVRRHLSDRRLAFAILPAARAWLGAGTIGLVAEQQLAGGVANAGKVTREGAFVLRPQSQHSASIRRFLLSLRAAGFDGASLPVSIEPDGRERLEFIEGDVPLPPYPDWAQSDSALASVAALLRRLHDASRSFDRTGTSFSAEMSDPAGDGPVICHNDVCLENVVFRSGQAIGLLDFDYAAPGRPVYDLARFAVLCVPVNFQQSAARLGWRRLPAEGKASRVRLIADSYGLSAADRAELIAALSERIDNAGAFVQRRVAEGNESFIKMWNDAGGAQRLVRLKDWFAAHQQVFADALA